MGETRPMNALKSPEHVRIGVHVAHCCTRHGCKYALRRADQMLCPVTSGKVQQDGPCETCSYELEELGDLPMLMNDLYRHGYDKGHTVGYAQGFEEGFAQATPEGSNVG